MIVGKKRIIIGISGASGVVCAIDLLQLCAELDIETHCIISKNAEITIKYETDYTPQMVRSLANVNYAANNISAPCASGSQFFDAMIITPCSMKTLGEIALSITSNLLTRSAEVQLKERRPLILMVRETPLTLQHCRNMVAASENGAIIMPPLPSFYLKPQNLGQMIRQINHRALNLCGIFPANQEIWQ